MIHRHTWKVVSAHYTLYPEEDTSMFVRSKDDVEHWGRCAHEGITNVVAVCTQCGDIRHTEIYGDHSCLVNETNIDCANKSIKK